MKYRSSRDLQEVVKKDYRKSIIFDLKDFENDGHLLQTVTIPPRTKQRVHFHDKQTEVFYILEGECEIFINGNEFDAKPGDAFICEPKDKHNLWNKSDKKFKLLVFKIAMPSVEDTHWEDENK